MGRLTLTLRSPAFEPGTPIPGASTMSGETWRVHVVAS